MQGDIIPGASVRSLNVKVGEDQQLSIDVMSCSQGVYVGLDHTGAPQLLYPGAVYTFRGPIQVLYYKEESTWTDGEKVIWIRESY